MENKDLVAQINALLASVNTEKAKSQRHDEIDAAMYAAEALEQLKGTAKVLSDHGIPATEKELETVLDDYKKQGEQLGKMILRYETEERPLRQGEMYLCPHCHHRIRINHGHCHWCGGLIGWDGNGGRHGKKK